MNAKFRMVDEVPQVKRKIVMTTNGCPHAGHRSTKFLCTALGWALLALPWVLGTIAAAEETRALNLLCWSEYVPKEVIDGFTRRTGARVVVENYNSNEQMLAMLGAKPGHYDIVQPSQFYVEKLIQAGGLEAIDADRIPNLRHIDPKYRGLAHDPEGKYSVPWMSGTVGIVTNTARVKEPVKTYADLFSGKHTGRIVVVNDRREMVAWALASLGLPPTDVNDANLLRVEPVLLRWLPQVAVFDSDSPHTSLLDGRADVGVVWSGEAALLWQRDRKFRYVLPKEGAHMFLDSLAIPAGAPHKLLAEEFIDHCLDPAVSVQISNAYPYTNPNQTARGQLTPEQLANPASYLPGDPRLQPLRNVGNDAAAVDRLVGRVFERIGR